MDLLTQEVLSFKNLLQQKNHEETIKYVQEVIDKSWETLNAMEDKETLMIAYNKQVEEVKMLSEAVGVIEHMVPCTPAAGPPR